MKAYERQKRAEEIEEEREARLHRMRERLQNESEKERQARLQQMNANQRERLQDETDEEREARLQQMRERLQNETDEEQQARLEQMRANQRARIHNETEEEQQVRLEQRRGASDIPLLQQRLVQVKMNKFVSFSLFICHHANHVSVPPASWTVWLQWPRHQPATRCLVICPHPASTTS